MTMSTVSEFQNLSVEQRLQLIETIWESLVQEGRDIPVPDEHIEEIDRRLDDLELNPDDSSPWEEVRGRILRQAK
jgi:putative addiction module component (TIGR02574 family)